MRELYELMYSWDEVHSGYGMNYRELPDVPYPRISVDPAIGPGNGGRTKFTIDFGDRQEEILLLQSHLAMLALLRHWSFSTVLDVGTGGGEATRIFRAMGKQVWTNDVPARAGIDLDFPGDVLEIDIPRRFDLVWASHVLEHQRNPGAFIDRCISLLNDDGILCITVPFMETTGDPHLQSLGHHNKYDPVSLLYTLACAGLDCRQAAIRLYRNQVSVIAPVTGRRQALRNIARDSRDMWERMGLSEVASNTADTARIKILGLRWPRPKSDQGAA